MRKKKSGREIWYWATAFCLFLTIVASCQSKERYVGTYQSEAPGPRGAIILELRSNGDGLWKVRSQGEKDAVVEVPITWSIKRGDLRVNTKAGGVIVGKIEGDKIRVTLPGPKTVTFARAQ
jgi:hypothetical protein